MTRHETSTPGAPIVPIIPVRWRSLQHSSATWTNMNLHWPFGQGSGNRNTAMEHYLHAIAELEWKSIHQLVSSPTQIGEFWATGLTFDHGLVVDDVHHVAALGHGLRQSVQPLQAVRGGGAVSTGVQQGGVRHVPHLQPPPPHLTTAEHGEREEGSTDGSAGTDRQKSSNSLFKIGCKVASCNNFNIARSCCSAIL